MNRGSAVEWFADSVGRLNGGVGLALPTDIEIALRNTQGDEAIGGRFGSAF